MSTAWASRHPHMATTTATARRIVFPRPNEVLLEEVALPNVGPDDIRVRTDHSLVSTGTEGIVFRHLVAPDGMWAQYATYPFFPGYASVGVVEAVGEAVRNIDLGQRVVWRRPHASHHVLPLAGGGVIDYCLPVPDGVSSSDALWFALGHIAFRGAQVASHRLGDEVLIVGAGPVGQMSVRWAHAAGAGRIAVVDPFVKRLDLAERGGATFVVAAAIEDAQELLGADGEIPAVIIDTTGNARVFECIQKLAPRYARIVMLGNTGTPHEQRLTDHLIHDGLTVTGAQDVHEYGGWTQQGVQTLLLRMLADGRISVAGLNTNTFNPADCQSAYELPWQDRGATMGIVFDWTTE